MISVPYLTSREASPKLPQRSRLQQSRSPPQQRAPEPPPWQSKVLPEPKRASQKHAMKDVIGTSLCEQERNKDPVAQSGVIYREQEGTN